MWGKKGNWEDPGSRVSHGPSAARLPGAGGRHPLLQPPAPHLGKGSVNTDFFFFCSKSHINILCQSFVKVTSYRPNTYLLALDRRHIALSVEYEYKPKKARKCCEDIF